MIIHVDQSISPHGPSAHLVWPTIRIKHAKGLQVYVDLNLSRAKKKTQAIYYLDK